MANGISFFSRYIDAPKKQPVSPKIQHAQKLLDFLQRWDKPTICTRDILIYGPRSLRNPKNAIDSAEILVRNGWLTPAKKHRFDMNKWHIVRKPVIPSSIAT